MPHGPVCVCGCDISRAVDSVPPMFANNPKKLVCLSLRGEVIPRVMDMPAHSQHANGLRNTYRS
jgi:hypothetical protein